MSLILDSSVRGWGNLPMNMLSSWPKIKFVKNLRKNMNKPNRKITEWR